MKTLIGIFGRRAVLDCDPPFLVQTHLFQDFCIEAAKIGINAFVFSHEDVDLKSKIIRGSRYFGKWMQKNYPFPHVFYDRGFFRDTTDEAWVSANKLRHVFHTLRIPFINPLEIVHVTNDKLAFAQIMDQAKLAHPETLLATHQNVTLMLEKHERILLKPRKGRKGRGIIWLKRDDDLNAVQHIFHSRDYILQEALECVSWEEKKTYIRVLMQRDEHGVLQKTASLVRLVGERMTFLSEDTFIRVPDIRNQISSLAFECIQAMENFCGVLTGDIGLDFLLDVKGKPWILEANAKPGRRIALYSPEIRKQSIQRVLAYGQYLKAR